MSNCFLAATVFPSLAKYLIASNWLAAMQFGLFVAIMCLLVDRALRATALVGKPLAMDEPVASSTLDSLTRLCLGLGLLLTFSGLYGYIGSGRGGDQDALLMALGSSALGYSAWTLAAIAAVIDALRRTYNGRAKNDEQELVVDPRSRRGPVGGLVRDPDPPAAIEFGSLDGYQRFECPSDSHLGHPRPDLAEERSNRALATHESSHDDSPDPPPPESNGRPKREKTTGGSPAV